MTNAECYTVSFTDTAGVFVRSPALRQFQRPSSMQKPQNTTNVAIILTDADRRVLWVNDYFSTLTGYDITEVRGRKPSVLQGERSDQRIIQEMRTCLEMGISFKNEITNYTKSGELYQCRLVVHPVRDGSGAITNFIAFAIDSTQASDDSALDLMHFSSKYQTSSLKGVKSLELYERLRRTMINEQLYLDPQLNLPQLADLLETNTKYLSQVVNYHYGNNLQQFVNVYRIEEAKKRLLDLQYANLTYFAIGQLCGFKNKSTFYKVFKKFTDCTPHEYVLVERRVAEEDKPSLLESLEAVTAPKVP